MIGAAVMPQRTSLIAKMASSAAIAMSQRSGYPDAAAKAPALNDRYSGSREMPQAVDCGHRGSREFEVFLGRRRAEIAQKREIGPGLEMPAGAP